MAVYNFAEFELNEELGQLFWRGDEVNLQPRAFDLLACLVRNHSRVVDKGELLMTLWPGVVVTDSSVQRAVSLARQALRRGGMDDAIRTFTRRGYRFMLNPESGQQLGHPASTNQLKHARALLDQGFWREAADAFALADGQETLAPADLESWAVALQCAGTSPAAIEPFERAARVYSNRGECEAAARAVISLARIHFEMREWSVTKGCLSRAETILDGLPLCEQHGHLEWMRSWLASYEGDAKATIGHALKTIDAGRQLGNIDLEAMGLLFWGIALQASGNTRRGLELQDEAGAAVLTGGVTPLLGGLVYCGLIGGCCNTGDWPRARQWSESFTGWCQRNGVRRFSGSCLLHRVEVFIARGELGRAEAELIDSDETISMSSSSVIADARRYLADIFLLRGDFDKAETAYRDAYEAGSNPHPGYALLLHYRGQSRAAVRALRQSTESVDWSEMERKPLYLAFAAIIAAQSGDLDTASQVMNELEAQPDAWAVGTMHAHVLRARGEINFSLDNHEQARRLFSLARRVYQDMDSPLDAAAIRLRLAETLFLLADREGTLLELESAEAVFKRTDAQLYKDDCLRIKGMMDSYIHTG